MVQFPGAHFGGLIAGEFLFIYFLWYNLQQPHSPVSSSYLIVYGLLAHPSFSNRRGIVLLFYYIQLYHRHEVGLGVVDVLFLACDKPFFSIVTKYPSSLVLAD
jgi:hypothetical protein